MNRLNVFRLPSAMNRYLWKRYMTSQTCLSATQADKQVEHEHPEHPDKPVFTMQNPFEKEKKQCVLCKHKIPVDYKNVRLLSQFISPYTGFLYQKHITGLCEAQQQRITKAVKKSWKYGYLPAMFKPVKYVKDPKLYDPFNPTRPHPH